MFLIVLYLTVGITLIALKLTLLAEHSYKRRFIEMMVFFSLKAGGIFLILRALIDLKLIEAVR